MFFWYILFMVTCSNSTNPVISGQKIEERPGTSYYVSSSTGNDQNDGLSQKNPWQTFVNFDSLNLQPGDSVLLKAGDRWIEELHLSGTGKSDTLIVLSKYGTGYKPRITRNDIEYDYCIVIEDASFWHISELDCRSAKLGLYLRYNDTYNNKDVTVTDCYFQDMYSETIDPALHDFEYAWSAGIFLGGHVWDPAQLNEPVLTNLTIRRCAFYNTGVGFINNWYWPEVNRKRLENVIMEYCWAEKCFGGGAALNMASGVVRYNRFKNNGGYFKWGVTAGFAQSCEDLIIEMNEFAFTQRQDCPDGTGFDFEGDNHNCIFRKNYIHENDGAAILVMSTIDDNVNLNIEDNIIFNNCLDASSFDYRFELLCHNGDNKGKVQDNIIMRNNARKHFSENWAKFEKSGNELLNYEGVTPDMPFEWPDEAKQFFKAISHP